MPTLELKKERVRINQQKSGLMEAFIRAAFDTQVMVLINYSGSARFNSGCIKAMDQFCILIDAEEDTDALMLVYKSAIETISLAENEQDKLTAFHEKLTAYMDEHIQSKNIQRKKNNSTVNQKKSNPVVIDRSKLKKMSDFKK